MSIDIDIQILGAVSSVSVSIQAFDGLHFLVVGDVNRNCIEHRIECVAVDIARKTPAVFVRRFGICRSQIDRRAVPNDICTGCILILASGVVRRHLFSVNDYRECHGCLLREERFIEEEAISELKVFSCTAGYSVAFSCCRIFNDNFRRRFNADIACGFGFVKIQHPSVKLILTRIDNAIRCEAKHKEVPCVVKRRRCFGCACASAISHTLHFCICRRLCFIINHRLPDSILLAIYHNLNGLNTGSNNLSARATVFLCRRIEINVNIDRRIYRPARKRNGKNTTDKFIQVFDNLACKILHCAPGQSNASSIKSEQQRPLR